SPDRGPAPPRHPRSRAVATEGTDSMGSIAFDPADVIVGVDTHKDQHVAVALDGLGRRLGERFVSAAPAGYADLLAWAAGLGRVAAVGGGGHGRPRAGAGRGRGA